MIYTIKCGLGTCGARHEYVSENREPAWCEDSLKAEADKHGWVKQKLNPLRWLCPFHAPKAPEASYQPRTHCVRIECGNMNKSLEAAALVKDGWHYVPHNEPGKHMAWYCPACWKTTQPEPPTAGSMLRKAWETAVTDVAAEAFYVGMDRLLRDAERLNMSDSLSGKLGLWECLKIALAYQRPEPDPEAVQVHEPEEPTEMPF